MPLTASDHHALVGSWDLALPTTVTPSPEPSPTPTPSPTPAPAPSPVDVTSLQANLCATECPATTQADRTSEVVALLTKQCPDVVGLDEVCQAQVAPLLSGLSAAGLGYQAAFVAEKSESAADCGAIGNAVLTLRPMSDVVRTTFTAQTTSGVKRGIVCATVGLGRDVRVCATHVLWQSMTSSTAVSAAQVQQAVTVAESAGLPVMLLGDLNTTPADDRLDPVYDAGTYDGGASGRLLEADSLTATGTWCRCGTGTLDSSSTYKIDDTFATATTFRVRARAGVVPLAASDHHALVGGWSLNVS